MDARLFTQASYSVLAYGVAADVVRASGVLADHVVSVGHQLEAVGALEIRAERF